MSGTAAEARGGPPGTQKTRESAGIFLAFASVPGASTCRTIAPHRRPHVAPRICLASFVASLAALFVASILLEALDGDVALWPRGAGNLTAAPHGNLVRNAQDAGAFPALQWAFRFVKTAGALLVMRYRARSALATDAPFLTVMPFTLAEPWGPRNDWRPGARPLYLGALCRWLPRTGWGEETCRPRWMHP